MTEPGWKDVDPSSGFPPECVDAYLQWAQFGPAGPEPGLCVLCESRHWPWKAHGPHERFGTADTPWVPS